MLRRSPFLRLFLLIILVLAGMVEPNGSSSAANPESSAAGQPLTASSADAPRGWNARLDPAQGSLLPRARETVDSYNATLQGKIPNLAQSSGWYGLLHNPMTGSVSAIAFVGSDLYIGGNFTFTADDGVTTIHHIAKYSGGVWSALDHGGLNTTVYALAVMGSDLYVGGMFNTTADGAIQNLNNVAKYSTISGTWTVLPHLGIGGYVFAMAVVGSDLYVGGQFISTADGQVPDLNNIARFSGGAWYALTNKGLNGPVQAMAVVGGDLYVGGNFDFTFDMAVLNLKDIARYNAAVWYGLPHGGVDNVITAMAADGSDLYIGGQFTKTNDGVVTGLNHVAKYSRGAWSGLAQGGLNNYVRALAVSAGNLYAGGGFAKTFDLAVNNLNFIARYNLASGSWSALPNQGLSSDVMVLSANGSDLYAGGDFGGTHDAQYTGQIVKLGSSINLFLPLIVR